MSKFFKLIFLATILTTGLANSQNDTIKKEEPKLKFSGYTDFNYFKNLNNPLSGKNDGASQAARAFDKVENQFQLGLVQTKTNYVRDKSEVMLDIVFGPHGDLGNYGNVIGPMGKGTTALAIKQAYFNYKFTKKFTLTAGQFGTHVGYEVIDAPVNYNYSLNNLFNNGPFYHIGIKGTYALHSKVNLMAGIVNNWDNLYDNNKFKTAIAQLNYNPNSKMVIYLNYIGGNENSTPHFNSSDSLQNFKQLLDLVITWQVTDKFYLGINGVAGQLNGRDAIIDTLFSPKKVTYKSYAKNWGGVALYSNYQFSKMFGLGLRAEFFDNSAGVLYIGKTDVQSLTLTGKFSFDDDHFFIKPEIRMDNYKKLKYTGPDAGNIQQFEDSKGHYTKNSQITVGLAFIYKY